MAVFASLQKVVVRNYPVNRLEKANLGTLLHLKELTFDGVIVQGYYPVEVMVAGFAKFSPQVGLNLKCRKAIERLLCGSDHCDEFGLVQLFALPFEYHRDEFIT